METAGWTRLGPGWKSISNCSSAAPDHDSSKVHSVCDSLWSFYGVPSVDKLKRLEKLFSWLETMRKRTKNVCKKKRFSTWFRARKAALGLLTGLWILSPRLITASGIHSPFILFLGHTSVLDSVSSCFLFMLVVCCLLFPVSYFCSLFVSFSCFFLPNSKMYARDRTHTHKGTIPRRASEYELWASQKCELQRSELWASQIDF